MLRGIALLSLACLLAGLGFVSRVHAAPVPACVADDVIAADPGCPATGPCTITKVFSVSDGCVLDFGTRDVTVTTGGELRVLTASVTLRAGTFTVGPRGLVEGNTSTVGGSFTVEATGDIVVRRTDKTGKIRMSGQQQGGSVWLDAGGDIRIEGQLQAHNRTAGAAAGGDITLRAAGDIFIPPGGEVDPHGGQQAFGGFLDMVAGGLIDIASPIDNTGGDGGTISMLAGGSITIGDKLDATGQGDAGSGGDIDIIAGTDVVIAGKVHSRGTGSATGSGGGDGGAVFISASFGNITVSDEVNVQSGTPDGGGGDIELFARGWIDVQPLGLLAASGNGFESDGGEVLLDAGTDITINGLVEAEGGDSGGDIGVDAGRDIAIHDVVRARSTNQGTFGGSVTIQAGLLTSGSFTLTGTIDASGPGCDAWGFCSLGGDVDVAACDLTIEPLGVITVAAPGVEGNGGATFLLARDQMTIAGSLDATGAGGPLDGSNTLAYPSGVPPILTGSLLPAPITMPRAMCTGSVGDPPFCLDPCPVCGDGVTEFPETCDDTTGTPASCDGCSWFCQLEDCDDANPCTTDSCDPVLGCQNIPQANGIPCGDGTICNGEEVCRAGVCLAGQALDCNDNNACTLDSCDPVAGCQNDPRTGEPCSDNNACTDQDACDALGACVPGSQIVCDDGNECTEDICDPASGCVFSLLYLDPCTDDGDPCTNDVCFLGICAHPNRENGSSCDDGNACTQTDTCQGGICTGSNPVVCAADQCHDAGECDPATGVCSRPPKQDGTVCDDGSLCTRTDSCQGGVCLGSDPVVCTALNQCHDAGICEPTTGICSSPQRPDGTPCSDGLFCTVDSCQGGVCTSTARDCSDGNSCTTGSCDESADTCVQEPVTPCCGNGILEGDEECDEGTGNSDEPNSPCRTDCTMTQCGNGVLDDLLGETCDLGEANSDEPNAMCRTDCLEQRCGDGVVDDLAGEQCDDGGSIPDDGCSPRCFIEPSPSASLIPGKGSTKTDCIIEWKMENVALDKRGRPSHKQSCADGDISCDHDGGANGECLFHVWVCANNTDPRLPLCVTGTDVGSKGVVAVVQVKKPNLKRALRIPIEGETRERLLAAAAAAPVGTQLNQCGPRISIRVPHKGLGRKGVATIRLKAFTSLNVKDTDVLKLFCLP